MLKLPFISGVGSRRLQLGTELVQLIDHILVGLQLFLLIIYLVFKLVILVL